MVLVAFIIGAAIAIAVLYMKKLLCFAYRIPIVNHACDDDLVYVDLEDAELDDGPKDPADEKMRSEYEDCNLIAGEGVDGVYGPAPGEVQPGYNQAP